MIYQILCIALINLPTQTSIAKDSETALSIVAQSPTLDRLRILEEKERQEKLNEKARWRQFPEVSKPQTTGVFRLRDGYSCSYRWPSWEFIPSENRWITIRKCGDSIHRDGAAGEYIAVSCLTLKLSLQKDYLYRPQPAGWSAPRSPENEGEREMLAALCGTIGNH